MKENRNMVLALVSELQAKKIVCVPMTLVCYFVVLCNTLQIDCCGGALSNDFSSQYFYI